MQKDSNSDNAYFSPNLYAVSDQAIGRRIRECRKGLRLTQEELATQLGVSTSYISFLETGKRPLTHQITLPLLRCLNVSYNYLILGQKPEGAGIFGAVCEASSYNERLKLEHLLEHCTKAEYEMCFQLCNAYLETSRSKYSSLRQRQLLAGIELSEDVSPDGIR